MTFITREQARARLAQILNRRGRPSVQKVSVVLHVVSECDRQYKAHGDRLRALREAAKAAGVSLATAKRIFYAPGREATRNVVAAIDGSVRRGAALLSLQEAFPELMAQLLERAPDVPVRLVQALADELDRSPFGAQRKVEAGLRELMRRYATVPE